MWRERGRCREPIQTIKNPRRKKMEKKQHVEKNSQGWKGLLKAQYNDWQKITPRKFIANLWNNKKRVKSVNVFRERPILSVQLFCIHKKQTWKSCCQQAVWWQVRRCRLQICWILACGSLFTSCLNHFNYRFPCPQSLSGLHNSHYIKNVTAFEMKVSLILNY